MTRFSLATWVRSAAIASILTCAMLAVIIVGGEESPALKNWLKATFYHHWLGKGALALMLFAFITIFFRPKNYAPRGLSFLIGLEALVAALSALVIAGFFFLHLMGAV